MARINEPLYMPYGAFELKATYQRNLFLAMLAVTGLVVAGVISAWAMAGGPPPVVVINVEPYPDPEPMTWDDPGSYDRGGEVAPIAPSPPVDVPSSMRAIADSLMPDEAVVIPDKEELAEILDGRYGDSVIEGAPPGRGIGEMGGSGGAGRGERPERGSFQVVEIQPELIHSVAPEYPRLAKQAGVEGKVVIQALVGENGDVLDAVVHVGSGHVALDEAALAVAGDYKYRPAIQNGRPIAIWVTYTVEFKLD